MGSRRRAREFALQVLYAVDVGDRASQEALDLFWSGVEEDVPPDVREFTGALVGGVAEDRRRIDGIIEQFSVNWRLTRMPLVDRNILRIAVFEFLHCRDIPVMATINEAIELGKRFSTKESGSFINGILDKISRNIEFTKLDGRRST
ncbi:transcription antitermination factor NusB [Myxococcota bacterium]|nr:transcription antitermination factor NusB [Myxococcota bacterium]